MLYTLATFLLPRIDLKSCLGIIAPGFHGDMSKAFLLRIPLDEASVTFQVQVDIVGSERTSRNAGCIGLSF